jgi:cytochrome b561
MYILLVHFISGYLISAAGGRGVQVFGWFEYRQPAWHQNQEDIAGEIHLFCCVTDNPGCDTCSRGVKASFIDRDNTLSASSTVTPPFAGEGWG